MWQSSPVYPQSSALNLNVGSIPPYDKHLKLAATTGQITLGGLDTSSPGGRYDRNSKTAYYADILSFHAGKSVDYTGEPMSYVYIPVVDSFEDDRKIVAVINPNIQWKNYFEGIFTDPKQTVDVVLSNTCEGDFTYNIRGDTATVAGKGNLADKEYENMAETVLLDLNENKVLIEPNTIKLTLNQDLCMHFLRIYPTKEGEKIYQTILPLIITLTVAAVFVMTAAVFYFYDVMVERRQQVVLDTAQRSTAIVSSLFPKKVRDQMLQAPVQGNATKLRSLAFTSKTPHNHEMESVVDGCDASRPIADLFPHCTGELSRLFVKLFVWSEGHSTVFSHGILWFSHVCGCREFHRMVFSQRTLAGIRAP